MGEGVEALLARIRIGDASHPPDVEHLVELGRAPIAMAQLPIAVRVVQMMCSSVRVENAQVSDKQMAGLVSSGALDAALSLYAHHGPQPADSTELGALVHELIDAAGDVALMPHSGEALRRQSLHLRETAMCLSEAGAEQAAVEVLSLLQLADPASETALPETALDCCRGCGQVARAATLKRCAKCGTPYCCRECQVHEWKNGHKDVCKRLAAGNSS